MLLVRAYVTFSAQHYTKSHLTRIVPEASDEPELSGKLVVAIFQSKKWVIYFGPGKVQYVLT